MCLNNLYRCLFVYYEIYSLIPLSRNLFCNETTKTKGQSLLSSLLLGVVVSISATVVDSVINSVVVESVVVDSVVYISPPARAL